MSWKDAMENTNWLKQTPDKPLFPDVLWSRPENKRFAGKLLIVGGHVQSFNDVSAAYGAALKAGIGTVRVVLPDKLEKMLSKAFPEADYAPSTQIGSFSRQALDTLLQTSSWADGVLLAGDFGKNSETAVLLDGFAEKYKGKLTLAGDSIDYFLKSANQIIDRSDTVIAASVSQLQKLAFGRAFIKQDSNLAVMVSQLHRWSGKVRTATVTEHQGQIIAAHQKQISTTPVRGRVSLAELAAYASVWHLQQPERIFETLTCAVYEFSSH